MNEYDVVIKLTKNIFFVQKIDWFGYQIENGTISLSDDRKAANDAMPMPTSRVQVQRFLDMTIYCSLFVASYAELQRPLDAMTKADFDFHPTIWTVNYRADFDALKLALKDCLMLHQPHYLLPWGLSTDAADSAIATIL